MSDVQIGPEPVDESGVCPRTLQTVAHRLMALAGPFYAARETGGVMSATEVGYVLAELEMCANALVPRTMLARPVARGRFIHPGSRA